MEKIELNGCDLDISTLYRIATAKEGELQLTIASNAYKKMQASRQMVFDIVKAGKPVYGINTGFGALSNRHIQSEDLNQLQLNLIRSHCTGVGEPFSIDITRAIMVLRANCLIRGNSGVEPSIVQLLLDFINHHITPIVPKKGSVGASGDLAPLSHIALALIGEGDVLFNGKEVGSNFAMASIGKKAATLGPKDGLALINGTAVMCALGAMAVMEGEKLLKLSDISAALTLEAVQGTTKAYHAGISSLKPHPGQISSAKNMLRLVDGSKINQEHHECHRVQDPYSLRCIPQVHGACRQTIAHAKEVISTELNAVTDNPLIFVKENEVISGGNFHGEALALVMDYMAMGISELGNISERRVEKMMNPTFSELPAFLTADSGLNSGLMIAHVTAAALASENKHLCHPASVDSIPTSTDKEDHVSMGVTAGRKLHEVIDNVKHNIAIELLCNTQGIDLRRPLTSSKALEEVHTKIRQHVQPIKNDRIFHKDINNIVKLINSNELIVAAEKAIGEIL